MFESVGRERKFCFIISWQSKVFCFLKNKQDCSLEYKELASCHFILTSKSWTEKSTTSVRSVREMLCDATKQTTAPRMGGTCKCRGAQPPEGRPTRRSFSEQVLGEEKPPIVTGKWLGARCGQAWEIKATWGVSTLVWALLPRALRTLTVDIKVGGKVWLQARGEKSNHFDLLQSTLFLLTSACPGENVFYQNLTRWVLSEPNPPMKREIPISSSLTSPVAPERWQIWDSLERIHSLGQGFSNLCAPRIFKHAVLTV